MADLPALRGSYLPAAIGEIGEFATIAARSGMFGTSKPEELIVKLMAGASWGVPPMAAMTDVYVVKGKPMASGTLLRAMVRKSGLYDYRVLEHSDEAAEIEFMRVLPSGDREVIGSTRFDMARAKAQKLTSNQLYQTAPRSMLLARATSDGVKAHCPDVFMGSIYAEGEIEEDRPQPRQIEQTQTRRNPPEAPRQVEAELVDNRPEPARPSPLAQAAAELLDLADRIADEGSRQRARDAIDAMPDLQAASAIKRKLLLTLEAQDAAAAEAEPERDDEPEGPDTTVRAAMDTLWADYERRLSDDDRAELARRLDGCVCAGDLAAIREWLAGLTAPKPQPARKPARKGWQKAAAELDSEGEPEIPEGLL